MGHVCINNRRGSSVGWAGEACPSAFLMVKNRLAMGLIDGQRVAILPIVPNALPIRSYQLTINNPSS